MRIIKHCGTAIAILYRSLLFAGVLSFICDPLYAQSIGPSTIDAAGATFSGGGFSYDYTVGQIAVDNIPISASLIITPGVLQPDINTTGVAPEALSANDVRVYPDPVETTIFIQPIFKNGGKMQLGLYDAAGRLIRRQEATLNTGGELQRMDVAAFAAGQYMLQLIWVSGGVTYASGYKLQKLQ